MTIAVKYKPFLAYVDIVQYKWYFVIHHGTLFYGVLLVGRIVKGAPLAMHPKVYSFHEHMNINFFSRQ